MSKTTATLSRRRARVLAFPLAVGLFLLLLVAANVNGSSMAVLSSDEDPPGLIAGEPRPVRSDEYRLRTPIALSSVEQDFPRAPWIGLARIDQAATAHGGPTRDWSTLLKPQDWGYLILGADRGLAWSWWWSFAIGLTGSYLLLLTLTRRIALSVLGGVAAAFTPYAAWWTAPPPALFVGYGALAGGLFLLAIRTTRTSARRAYAALGGLAGAAFALALYPPWQVSLAWVVGAAALGWVLDHRVPFRAIASTLAATLTTALVPVAIWLVQNRDAISAIADTYYPGQRISQAGTGSLPVLLDSPLNFWMAGSAGATLGADGRSGPWANLSESASSWISLPVMLLVILAMVTAGVPIRRRRNVSPEGRTEVDRRGDVPWWTLTLVAGAALLLLAWSLLPLPELVGEVTLLNRVQPSRTPLALGLAQIILVVVAAHAVARRGLGHWGWVVGAALLTGATTLWSSTHLPWDDSRVPTIGAAASGIVLGGALAWVATQRRPAAGAAVLAVYAFASWVLVNPLQHGTAPLTQSSLAAALTSVADAEENPRVVVFGGFDTVAKVRAAGFQSVSGTTLYPDTTLMQRLAPGQGPLWNNYAQYLWSPARLGAPTLISQIQSTVMKLEVDVCNPVLRDEVAPGWVVTHSPLTAPCLTRLGQVQDDDEEGHWIYRVS